MKSIAAPQCLESRNIVSAKVQRLLFTLKKEASDPELIESKNDTSTFVESFLPQKLIDSMISHSMDIVRSSAKKAILEKLREFQNQPPRSSDLENSLYDVCRDLLEFVKLLQACSSNLVTISEQEDCQIDRAKLKNTQDDLRFARSLLAICHDSRIKSPSVNDLHLVVNYMKSRSWEPDEIYMIFYAVLCIEVTRQPTNKVFDAIFFDVSKDFDVADEDKIKSYDDLDLIDAEMISISSKQRDMLGKKKTVKTFLKLFLMQKSLSRLQSLRKAAHGVRDFCFKVYLNAPMIQEGDVLPNAVNNKRAVEFFLGAQGLESMVRDSLKECHNEKHQNFMNSPTEDPQKKSEVILAQIQQLKSSLVQIEEEHQLGLFGQVSLELDDELAGLSKKVAFIAFMKKAHSELFILQQQAKALSREQIVKEVKHIRTQTETRHTNAVDSGSGNPAWIFHLPQIVDGYCKQIILDCDNFLSQLMSWQSDLFDKLGEKLATGLKEILAKLQKVKIEGRELRDIEKASVDVSGLLLECEKLDEEKKQFIELKNECLGSEAKTAVDEITFKWGKVTSLLKEQKLKSETLIKMWNESTSMRVELQDELDAIEKAVPEARVCVNAKEVADVLAEVKQSVEKLRKIRPKFEKYFKCHKQLIHEMQTVPLFDTSRLKEELSLLQQKFTAICYEKNRQMSELNGLIGKTNKMAEIVDPVWISFQETNSSFLNIGDNAVLKELNCIDSFESDLKNLNEKIASVEEIESKSTLVQIDFNGKIQIMETRLSRLKEVRSAVAALFEARDCLHNEVQRDINDSKAIDNMIVMNDKIAAADQILNDLSKKVINDDGSDETVGDVKPLIEYWTTVAVEKKESLKSHCSEFLQKCTSQVNQFLNSVSSIGSMSRIELEQSQKQIIDLPTTSEPKFIAMLPENLICQYQEIQAKMAEACLQESMLEKLIWAHRTFESIAGMSGTDNEEAIDKEQLETTLVKANEMLSFFKNSTIDLTEISYMMKETIQKAEVLIQPPEPEVVEQDNHNILEETDTTIETTEVMQVQDTTNLISETTNATSTETTTAEKVETGPEQCGDASNNTSSEINDTSETNDQDESMENENNDEDSDDEDLEEETSFNETLLEIASWLKKVEVILNERPSLNKSLEEKRTQCDKYEEVHKEILEKRSLIDNLRQQLQDVDDVEAICASIDLAEKLVLSIEEKLRLLLDTLKGNIFDHEAFETELGDFTNFLTKEAMFTKTILSQRDGVTIREAMPQLKEGCQQGLDMLTALEFLYQKLTSQHLLDDEDEDGEDDSDEVFNDFQVELFKIEELWDKHLRQLSDLEKIASSQ